MLLKFWKYQGTGNDFVMVKNYTSDELTTRAIKSVCNRRFGVGADGFIRVTDSKDSGAAFEMIYHNSDGPVASFCGNGARCAVHFAVNHLDAPKKDRFIFKGKMIEYNYVSADHIHIGFGTYQDPTPWDKGYFIDTGSPHVVMIMSKNELDHLDIDSWAKYYRNHPDFEPIGGVNVNACSLSDDNIYMRTFERGVEAETLSCGTGTIAVASVVHQMNFRPLENHYKVQTAGGLLTVIFGKKLKLCGPAQCVFHGEINL